MLLTCCLRLRKTVLLLSGVLLFGCAASVRANPKPLTKEEQAKIDKAIDKGVAFLKRIQRDKGDWPLYMRNRFPLGQTLLPAYVLLETGVPANDRVIRKATDYIRPRVLKVDWTYEVSLALLFLDRLADPKDKPLIRSLALRLIAGQHVTGGWNYRCPSLEKSQEDALCKALTELNKGQVADEKARVALIKRLELPRSLSALAVFRDPRKLPWREPPDSNNTMYKTHLMGTTDNSNTQFALLGLWIAERHGYPVGPTFRLLIERFARSQLADGWWPYLFENYRDPEWIKRHPSMICVGLLSLAISRGLNISMPGTPQPGRTDLRILKALTALNLDIGVAAAGLEKANAMRGTYYLWSVESVAMLYDLPTIGEKDWYRWGATILLVNQNRDGSWKSVRVNAMDKLVLGPNWGLVPSIDTSFALLFLKRSHPMKELTPKLPVKGKELNRGITRLLNGEIPLDRTTITPKRSTKLQH